MYSNANIVTRDEVITRYNKLAGCLGRCGMNSELESAFHIYIFRICRNLVEGKTGLTIPELTKITEDYLTDDYTITFRNKRKSRSLAKERVRSILESTMKEIQQ